VGIRQLFASKLAVMTPLVWLVYFYNLLVIYDFRLLLPSEREGRSSRNRRSENTKLDQIGEGPVFQDNQ
jgi:hypothetical protein